MATGILAQVTTTGNSDNEQIVYSVPAGKVSSVSFQVLNGNSETIYLDVLFKSSTDGITLSSPVWDNFSKYHIEHNFSITVGDLLERTGFVLGENDQIIFTAHTELNGVKTKASDVNIQVWGYEE